MTSRRAGASFRLPKVAEEGDLANFAIEIGDLMEDNPDFQQEIGPTGIDRGKVLQDYIDSKKNPETVKKTRREAAAMQKWLEGQQENRPIEEIESGTLNIYPTK